MVGLLCQPGWAPTPRRVGKRGPGVSATCPRVSSAFTWVALSKAGRPPPWAWGLPGPRGPHTAGTRLPARGGRLPPSEGGLSPQRPLFPVPHMHTHTRTHVHATQTAHSTCTRIHTRPHAHTTRAAHATCTHTHTHTPHTPQTHSTHPTHAHYLHTHTPHAARALPASPGAGVSSSRPSVCAVTSSTRAVGPTGSVSALPRGPGARVWSVASGLGWNWPHYTSFTSGCGACVNSDEDSLCAHTHATYTHHTHAHILFMPLLQRTLTNTSKDKHLLGILKCSSLFYYFMFFSCTT